MECCTVTACIPVCVRAHHQGLIARSAATSISRDVLYRLACCVRPIVYTVKLYRENLIDRLGEIYDVMNGSPWLYAIVS